MHEFKELAKILAKKEQKAYDMLRFLTKTTRNSIHTIIQKSGAGVDPQPQLCLQSEQQISKLIGFIFHVPHSLHY